MIDKDIFLLGVQGIYIIAINDAFVTQAWKEKLNAKDSKVVHFLADDTGAVSPRSAIYLRTECTDARKSGPQQPA